VYGGLLNVAHLGATSRSSQQMHCWQFADARINGAARERRRATTYRQARLRDRRRRPAVGAACLMVSWPSFRTRPLRA